MDKMYVSNFGGLQLLPEGFLQKPPANLENLSHNVYTHSIQALLSPKLAGCSTHTNTQTFVTSLNFWRPSCIDLTQVAPHCSWLPVQEHLGWCQDPQGHPHSHCRSPHHHPFAQSKHQIVQAVYVKVAKEHESAAITVHHKALHTEVFRCMTNLMMKLAPLNSNHCPSMEQDIICHTITKLAQCLAEFEYVSNPHINLINEPSAALNNHSLCSIVMAYQHNWKKTFLSLDQDHSSGQVILIYPRKYWSEANGCACHLVKYMEYENGTPALHWFNYLGLAADPT